MNGFCFAINGGSTANNCYGSQIDIAFSPTDANGTAITGWTSVYVDVFWMQEDTENYQYLIRTASTEWHNVQLLSLSGLDNVFAIHEDLSASALVWLASNYGRPLFFNFKDSNTTATKSKLFCGRVDYQSQIYDQVIDANAALTIVKNRQTWLRNDVENVVFPRLRRALSLLGENLLLDNFSYDNAGNITGLRVRAFDSSANASAATIDETDSSTGEEVTLMVTQTHDLPRNVRSSHLSVASTEATDRTASDNSGTDVIAAPGNAGEWPA